MLWLKEVVFKMVLNSIFEGLLGILGSPFGVGIFILVFLFSLIVIKGLNYTETWLVVIVAIGALTTDYGGGYLPEWVLVIVLVPFGWVISEIIIKRSVFSWLGSLLWRWLCISNRRGDM